MIGLRICHGFYSKNTSLPFSNLNVQSQSMLCDRYQSCSTVQLHIYNPISSVLSAEGGCCSTKTGRSVDGEDGGISGLVSLKQRLRQIQVASLPFQNITEDTGQILEVWPGLGIQ